MDLDDEIIADIRVDLARESRAYRSPDGVVRCNLCGAKALVYGQDKNAEPVTDNRCAKCTLRILRNLPRVDQDPGFNNADKQPLCKYCAKATPLIGVWCGPCAIRNNELARDNGWCEKEYAEANIVYFQSLMKIKALSE